MAFSVLNPEAVRQAPLSREPYSFFLGSGVLKEDAIPDLKRDFPNITKPGYLTVNEVDLKSQPRLKDRPDSGAIGFQDHGLPLALRKIRVRRL